MKFLLTRRLNYLDLLVIAIATIASKDSMIAALAILFVGMISVVLLESAFIGVEEE